MQKLFGELKRYDNPMFWITSISQLLVVIQFILSIFGKEYLLDQSLQSKILQAVNLVVAFLGTMGVFTKGTPVPFVPPIEPIVPVEPVAPVVINPEPSPIVVPSEPVAPAKPIVAPVAPSAPVEPAAPASEPVKAEESPVDPAPSVVQGPTVIVEHDVVPGPVNQENK